MAVGFAFLSYLESMLVFAAFINFIPCSFAPVFPGRFWLLLPFGPCYLLLPLLHSFCVARFARVLPALEDFDFVTSWPMLSVATSTKFILCSYSSFCSRFPGMNGGHASPKKHRVVHNFLSFCSVILKLGTKKELFIL